MHCYQRHLLNLGNSYKTNIFTTNLTTYEGDYEGDLNLIKAEAVAIIESSLKPNLHKQI